MSAFVPRIVGKPPRTEAIVRALLTERDTAAALLARVDAMIDEQGRLYIAEKYPAAKEFGKPSLERLRLELQP